MATKEEIINADRQWLKDNLSTFEQYAVEEAGLDAQKVAENKISLHTFSLGIAFEEDMDGKPVDQAGQVSYQMFDIEEDDNQKEKRNLLALWLKYLSEHMHGMDDESRERRECLATSLMIAIKTLEDKPTIMLPLATMNRPWRQKAYEDLLAQSTMQASAGPSIEPDNNSAPSFAFMPPSAGWTSALSLAAGAGAGALFPIAATALFAGASKITICTALGFAGFPIAGMAAGLATGIIMGGLKNHKAIGAQMDAVEGVAKVGAWFNGMKDSVSFRQLAFNTIAGGLGGFGAGIALDLFGDSECVVDTFRAGTDAVGLSDWAGMEELRAANEGLGEHVTELTSENGELNSRLDIQQGEIDGLNSRVDAMESQQETPAPLNVVHVTDAVDAGTPVEATVTPSDTISCPSYISDCPDNGLLDVSDTINGVDVPETDVEIRVADAAPAEPEVVIANVTAPVEALTEAQTVVVKSGDTLTSIVEKFYNVAEGSAQFDKIMAEVANQNGLAGNQQNWLKVNWELTMPEIANAESLTGELDRASLDANWRAGDVTYSDAPKMAA